MKAKWLDRTIIIGPYLSLCTSEQEFNAALEYLCVPSGIEWCPIDGARTHNLSKGDDIVCVVCLQTKINVVGTIYSMLAHEAVHVWQYFCENIGEDDPSAEFEAYAIQNITQTLISEYMSRKKKR